MRRPQVLRAQVGRRTLDVPVYRDELTTLRIVNAVNERLKQIEGEGKQRVDTIDFLLRTALSFAVEAERLRDGHAAEVDEIELALAAIVKSIGDIFEEGASEEGPESPEPPPNVTPFPGRDAS